ncbi:MAG: hypothetical protein EHM20_08345 [Alphaproteobacteria bacterium]|nr:MAG: hypothetical protein EHM20_08345 [Alphaproteobacteria bacterium]
MLNEYLELSENSINLSEESIDNEIQLEFIECSKANEKMLSADEIIQRKEQIFDKALSTDQKKILLGQLASISNIEAYRTIERFLKEPNSKLYEWTYLALMANRLLIESHLLEENKVLITTGLGGKGHKLRYFIVFFTDDGSPITKLQQKIICNELNFALKKFGAEIEDIIFEDGFASFLTVVPMKVPVQILFDSIIKECNEFGGFLFDDYIITNSKVLSIEEIREFLAVKNIF